jgi:hypothetical protein
MSKEQDERYILNPETNRFVLKTGTIGKSIMNKKNEKIEIIKKIVPRLLKPTVPRKSILVLDKLGCWQVFQLSHFVGGINKIKYELLGAQQDKEHIINRIYITILVGVTILLKKEKSVIVESVQKVKWTTLIDNLNSSDFTIQIMNWYPMLVQVLTGIEKDLKPYWNQSYKEMSQKLWLPTLIDSPDSLPIYSNSCSDYVDANSWFTIKKTETTLDLKNNSSLMSSISSMSTLVKLMEDEKEKLNVVQRTRKVRIYPNKSIVKQFKTWIAGTVCIYNKVVYFQSTCSEQDKNMSQFDLREKFVNEKIVTRANKYVLNQGVYQGHMINGGNIIVDGRIGNKILNGPIINTIPNPELNSWVKKVPKAVRAGAIKDYCTGRKAAFENFKCGNIASFKMRYRNYKNDPAFHIENQVQSILNGKYIKLFPSVLKKANVSNPHILVNKGDRQFVEQYIGKKPEQECKIKYEYGQWYLIVPYKSKVSEFLYERGAGAIDPGVRKPLSLYDAERLISFDYKKDIYNKLITKLHLLQSLRDKKMVKNRSYKKARYRIRKRWVNLVNDMHYKCASYLVSNYKVIGLPPFKTSQMVTSSKLNKKTKLEMLNWGHFKFKTRLESKARQLSHILKIDESYTTQTCTNCGTLKYMGSNKIYECLNCKHKIGRDDGSARSIFMCMMHMRCV